MVSTKILPSPICPVLAAAPIASTATAGIFVADCDLDPYFWQEMYHRLGAAIDFGMALLPPVAADFGDGHALDSDRKKGVPDLLELERFNDGDDELHEAWIGERSLHRL